MQQKIAYHSSPALLWFVTSADNAETLMAKGIKPTKYGMLNTPQLKFGKAVYAVHHGDMEGAKRLRAINDIDNAVILTFAAFTFYECISETADNEEERDFLKENGQIHVGICAVPNAIVPKWIIPTIREFD